MGTRSVMFNARDFSDIYDDLDINLNRLGCAMIRTESPLDRELPVLDEWLYSSDDPDTPWVDGLVEHHHTTVRYGFLPMVEEKHVWDIVSRSRYPYRLMVTHIEAFRPEPEKNYECVVARVDSDELREVNQQLSILPNINTYPEYKPHITIGYFKRGYLANNGIQINRALKQSVETQGYYLNSKLLK